MVRPRQRNNKPINMEFPGVPYYNYTEKELKFIKAYFEFPSYAAASRAAGYKGLPSYIGWTIAQKPHMKAALAGGMGYAIRQLDMTAEGILREIARTAFSNIQNFYDDEGNPIPIQDLDPDDAAAVQGFDGLGRPIFWDKPSSLKALGAHLRLQLEQFTISLCGVGGGPIVVTQESNDERALRVQQQLLSEL